MKGANVWNTDETTIVIQELRLSLIDFKHIVSVVWGEDLTAEMEPGKRVLPD